MEVCISDLNFKTHFPFYLHVPLNCRLAFTHHSEDLTKHSAFSQRRLQQTFSTTKPQAKFLLVIKRVTGGNPPLHFPYFLHSCGPKTRDRKLCKSDIARLVLAKDWNRWTLFLPVAFHKLSAAVLPIVYVYMIRVSEIVTSHFRSCVTYPHIYTAILCLFMNIYIRCIQQEEGSFYYHIGLEIEEETSKMLRLGHSFIWCWN